MGRRIPELGDMSGGAGGASARRGSMRRGPCPGRRQRLPLAGDAYTAADAAYKAFEHGNHRASATSAAEAVALRSDLLRLHLLLIDSLLAAGDFAEAEQAIKAASTAFAGDRNWERGRPISGSASPSGPPAKVTRHSRRATPRRRSGPRATQSIMPRTQCPIVCCCSAPRLPTATWPAL